MIPGLKENLERVRLRIDAACQRAGRNPADVSLIAITKSVQDPFVEALLDLGVTDLGENRAVEGAQRVTRIRKPATWHFIGRLQTNKVKKVVEQFAVVHSVDRTELIEELDRRATRKLPIFVQVNVSDEASKAGFEHDETRGVVESVRKSKHLDCVGLMTMAPPGDPESARPWFRKLRELAKVCGVPRLSMGMSGDFEVAVEEGATDVRVGSALFENLKSH